jgi:hypothetical protein
LARYHLYRNNCWRFSKTLMTTRRHFPDEWIWEYTIFLR